ncbi:hypothetical protein EV363DRAFT_1443709 [Boletus edulis]|nr:hypothetical protein EV363DRAFT_1443709 [Boletus edulis]
MPGVPKDPTVASSHNSHPASPAAQVHNAQKSKLPLICWDGDCSYCTSKLLDWCLENKTAHIKIFSDSTQEAKDAGRNKEVASTSKAYYLQQAAHAVFVNDPNEHIQALSGTHPEEFVSWIQCNIKEFQAPTKPQACTAQAASVCLIIITVPMMPRALKDTASGSSRSGSPSTWPSQKPKIPLIRWDEFSYRMDSTIDPVLLRLSANATSSTMMIIDDMDDMYKWLPSLPPPVAPFPTVWLPIVLLGSRFSAQPQPQHSHIPSLHGHTRSPAPFSFPPCIIMSALSALGALGEQFYSLNSDNDDNDDIINCPISTSHSLPTAQH